MQYQEMQKIIFSVICLLLANSANAVVLLDENFNGTSLSPEWHIEQGFAEVNGGYVDIFGSTGGSRDGWIVAGEGSSWSNYHFSTHFIADGGGDNWFRGEIAFRVQDFHSWTTGTFYRLSIDTPIWGGGPGSNGGGTVALISYVNNKPSLVGVISPLPGIIADQDNMVDIWAIGNHIQVAINDTQLIDINDPNPILIGGVGLGAIWESHVRYDYAVVEDIPPIPEPETYAMLLAGLGLLGFMARRRKESAV